jgi:D-threonate/D-erythronate kinase
MIAVITDDLTEAVEITGICLRYGLKTLLCINIVPEKYRTVTRDDTELPGHDVLVIATDLRSRTEADAADLLRDITVTLKDAAITTVFKTIDRQLTGHVVMTLNLMLSIYIFRKIILQPADPGAGFCIKNGHLYRPITSNVVHETSGGETDTVEFSAIDVLIQSTSTEKIGLPVVVRATQFKGPGIFVPDCSSVADLKSGIQHQNDQVLHAGSSAFFTTWLEVYLRKHIQSVVFRPDPMRARFLMAIQTMTAENQALIDAAKRQGTAVVTFSDDFLKEKPDETALLNWTDSQAEFCEKTGQLIISLSLKKTIFPVNEMVLANRLALVIERVLGQTNVKEIIMTGESLALSVMNQLKWTTFEGIDELAPGIVRMHINDRTGSWFTYKSETFKWPDNLDK